MRVQLRIQTITHLLTVKIAAERARINLHWRAKQELTRTTTWNLPGPSGTRDCINIVNLSHTSPLKIALC